MDVATGLAKFLPLEPLGIRLLPFDFLWVEREDHPRLREGIAFELAARIRDRTQGSTALGAGRPSGLGARRPRVLRPVNTERAETRHGTPGRARRPRRAAPTGTTSGTTRVRGPPRRREMRIHCVIIFSLESRIVLEAVAAHGVAGSPGQAEAKWSGRNEILPRNNLGRRRGARRDTFGRDTFGRNELRPSPGSPPRALPGPVSAASGAAMKQKTVKQKRTRSRFLPITCPSRSTSPCLARQDLHSRANNGFARHATHDPCEARATRPTPIKTASGRPSPGF